MPPALVTSDNECQEPPSKTIWLYRQVQREEIKDKATHRLVRTSYLLQAATMEAKWEVRLEPSYPHNVQAGGT